MNIGYVKEGLVVKGLKPLNVPVVAPLILYSLAKITVLELTSPFNNYLLFPNDLEADNFS